MEELRIVFSTGMDKKICIYGHMSAVRMRNNPNKIDGEIQCCKFDLWMKV